MRKAPAELFLRNSFVGVFVFYIKRENKDIFYKKTLDKKCQDKYNNSNNY